MSGCVTIFIPTDENEDDSCNIRVGSQFIDAGYSQVQDDKAQAQVNIILHPKTSQL